MPLGFERLNERKQRSNANINFIKPLDSPDRATAQSFLERIAAQCYPVMKKNYISVMALEEYPANPEFLGRNFNAGECIQLVLKDKRGRWLGFRFVQMVMMHELAHCKQMNHSRIFWNVRNEYAKEMEGLWSAGYTGEGLWGRGQDLVTGAFVHDHAPESSDIPQHLCGGTYRRARGRKRKRRVNGEDDGGDKPNTSYAERQQRRIARRFGKDGEGSALGEDELVRGALESGPGKSRGQGKPRVASSKRGRELRASAALARIEALQSQQAREKRREGSATRSLDEDEGSETDSDEENWDPAGSFAQVREHSSIGTDSGLVKVCGDEDEDEGARDEMNELRSLGARQKQDVRTVRAAPVAGRAQGRDLLSSEKVSQAGSEAAPGPQTVVEERLQESLCGSNTSHEGKSHTEAPNGLVCNVCSLENESNNLTCMACSKVLKPALMPDHWRCQSDTCRDSTFTNSGDAGRCALCGAKRLKKQSSGGETKGSARRRGQQSMGTTQAELLRWD